MTAATLTRRWQSLRARTRTTLIVLTIAGLLGGWGLLAWLYDPWPVRATLKTSGDTFPLAFSPDGRDLLTSSGGGIDRWDVSSGDKEGEAWAVPAGENTHLGVFSPDGRTFAALSATKAQPINIHVFDARSGKVRWSQSVPFRMSWRMVFLDEGRSLRAFLGDLSKPNTPMTAITWDVETGRELANRPLNVPKGGIDTISADAKIAALSQHKKLPVELWDLDADRSLGSVMNPRSTSVVHWGGVGLTDDGKTLAIGREDGTLELWDVPTRTLKATHAVGLLLGNLKFSPDGRTIVANAGPVREGSTLAQIQRDLHQLVGFIRRDIGEVVVLDVATGRRLALASNAFLPYISPDGRVVATLQSDRSIKLRDVPGSK